MIKRLTPQKDAHEGVSLEVARVALLQENVGLQARSVRVSAHRSKAARRGKAMDCGIPRRSTGLRSIESRAAGSWPVSSTGSVPISCCCVLREYL